MKMLKLYITFILLSNLFLSILSLNSENISTKLQGTPISSDHSSPLIQNAFDGDLNTEFKSEQSSFGWIGLKLDSKYRITKIGWSMKPQTDKSSYLLGIFEGSNDSTFSDAAPLYMIKSEITPGIMNYVTIEVTKHYKYIRYVGPSQKYCPISELEIYGDEDASLDDEEKFWYQPTNIPLVSIHTEDSIEPFDKENYLTCNILIVNKNKKESKETASIKLRGNATLRLEKKPYKIKFESKINPLNLPAKAKKWTLLANHSDKTLIRNSITYYISSLFEMKFTPSCIMVDLMLNGEYKGNYGFCDQVEKGKNRIKVDDMDEKCIEEPCVTGGYVLAADAYAEREGSFYKTKKGIIYTLDYPEEDEIVKEQEDYITNYFNIVEEEVYEGIVDKIDIESFCKYLLIEDLSGNGEAYWSTYMTKLRNDEKIYFGPAWDMDLAFDNDNRIYPTLEKNDFIFKYGTSAGTMSTFASKVLENEKVLLMLKEIWNDYSKSKITKEILVKFINEQIENIDQSQRLNFIRWDILNKKVLLNPVARGSYKAETDYVKEYIQKRFDIVTSIVNKEANK